MDRLTSTERYQDGHRKWNPGVLISGMIDRLAEYEDTGLAPEEIQELEGKNIAKKPIFHREVFPEHQWRMEDGEIDIYAFELDYHNGPVCERCHYSFCVGCNRDGFDNHECIVKWHECPTCHAEVIYHARCKCGQLLDWDERWYRGKEDTT